MFEYVWRVRAYLPERYGQRCRVTVQPGKVGILVTFEDGFKAVTSRNYVRRAK